MNTAQTMLDSLTEREQEILRLLDEGHTDHEIVHKLSLAVRTVKWHNRQMYDKLAGL